MKISRKVQKSSIVVAATVLAVSSIMLPAYAAGEETVYSKLSSDGNQYKTIISTKDGNYVDEKNSNKELPIDCKITYYLDGKEISAKKLAGRKGHVKISITYTNKDGHDVAVNGQNTTMYTPFVVVSGTMIDTDNNSNIKVTNGKVINQDGKTFVVGVTMPGMQQNLQAEDVDIPDTIDIEMDTDNFKMNNIMTYSTPKLLDKNIDWSQFDTVFNQVSQLKKSSDQIASGANTIKNGASSLTSGAAQLQSGSAKLASGAKNLDANMAKASAGANKLSSGATQINSGVATIINSINAEKNKPNSYASQIASLKQLKAGNQKLYDSIMQFGGTAEKPGINESLNELEDNANKQLQQLDAAERQGATVPQEQKDALNNAIKLYEYQKAINIGTIEMLAGKKSGSDAHIGNIEAIDQVITAFQNVQADVIKTENELLAGMKKLQAGTSQLKNGAASLNNGMKQLSSGAHQLSNGASALNSGIGTLTIGSRQLESGLGILTDGINQFNTQGINKIYDMVNNKVYNLVQRGRKLEELSNSYANFDSGDSSRDNVRFITITDSIKKSSSK